MNDRPGSAANPLRIATVGSGPSAFYAVESLLKVPDLHTRIDMFDRLPTPFGLVRGGVAPDHQNIKSVVKVYQKTADHHAYRFFGKVKIGTDIQIADLESCYHMVIWAIGCETDNTLGIPGENLRGVHSATEFVGWYNGHPDYRDRTFQLPHSTRVAVIGNGNVAMDVSRILLKDPAALVDTDIAEHALAVLRQSKVREVILLGRRGPAQAAFSPKEIEEIEELDGVDVVVRADEAQLDPISAKWLETQPRSAQRNVKFLIEQATHGEGAHEKKLRCRFLVAPVELEEKNGRLSGVRVQHAVLEADSTGTPRPKPIDRWETIEVDLLFKAVGYRGVPVPGLSFDSKKGIVPNTDGRVLDKVGGTARRGHYVVGWAKRGPSGLIGTNSPDSKATVEKMIEDLGHGTWLSPKAPDITSVLKDRRVDFVSYEDWQKLDAWEQQEGTTRGKVRHKLPSIDDLMAVVRRLRNGG